MREEKVKNNTKWTPWYAGIIGLWAAYVVVLGGIEGGLAYVWLMAAGLYGAASLVAAMSSFSNGRDKGHRLWVAAVAAVISLVLWPLALVWLVIWAIAGRAWSLLAHGVGGQRK